MVVIFQLLVPILIVAQTPFIPESPRWYVKKGKFESARDSLARVRDTEQEVADELLMIREAIEFHLEGMREDGDPIPKPTTRVHQVEVA